ncbi:MAG: hypothetical protein COC16_05160 [Lutibacter sp.]|nr:MAG: hypothetical protein COC16_05160 [Lutibacter sp.]
MQNQQLINGKTIAVISYITWIGTLIAFLINNSQRNLFASFHIRQAIGISAFSLINSFILLNYIDLWIVGSIGMVLFVFRIIGIMGALKNEERKIPFIADLFQNWFKGIA